MNNLTLEKYLNDYLQSQSFSDYCPNGLQVEGKDEISKVICGVTASQELLDLAVREQADAVLVHHGIFWKGDPQGVRGILYHRLKTLLDHNINLYAYHLPLDAHPECGNNVLLAKIFQVEISSWCDSNAKYPMVPLGVFQEPVTLGLLRDRIDLAFNRKSFSVGDLNRRISKIAWCSGSASEFLPLAASCGAEVFITGEFPERVVHESRELGVCVIAAGHHDTETAGIRRLGEILSQRFPLDCQFVNLANPL